MFDKGYEAYHQGIPYTFCKNVQWLNGWIKAERESRCGWYDRYGRRK